MPTSLPGGVDERAAGVAGVDRRVGLQQALERRAPSACTVRSRPETMPWVTVGPPPRPSGKPIASTPSPSRSLDERPSGTGMRSLSGDADDREVALGGGADHRARDAASCAARR